MQEKTKRLAGAVARVVIVLGAAWLVRDRAAATHAIGWVVAGWALTALVAVRAIMLVRKASRGWRQHTADGVNLASVDKMAVASMPPWTQAWYAMEKLAYRFTWRALVRAPLQAAGPFGVAGGANGGTRTISLSMSATVCAVAIAYSLPHYFSPLWPLAGAWAVLAIAFLYALVWIVGERRSVKEGGHAIAGGVLLLDLGLRASARIDLASVSSCVAIGGRARRDHVWRFTPGEKTNVALDIERPFQAVVRGAAREIPAGRVVLYVDDPAGFVAAVNRAAIACRQARASPGLGSRGAGASPAVASH